MVSPKYEEMWEFYFFKKREGICVIQNPKQLFPGGILVVALKMGQNLSGATGENGE